MTARHILVPNLALAQKVEADLKAGKSFADEAKQYSTDPGSKDKGGDLGTFKRGQMVPAFDKVAFTLPIGQISAPVKSPFGFHIIQVQARIPAQKATLASATPQIVEALNQQQEAPLIQPFLQSLQSKATVVTTNPAYAGLFPSPMPYRGGHYSAGIRAVRRPPVRRRRLRPRLRPPKTVRATVTQPGHRRALGE